MVSGGASSRANSPLPSSSGLVEAGSSRCARSSPTGTSHRCRRAAASLKPREAGPCLRLRRPHRCRRAAASLKRPPRVALESACAPPHRCRRAAASLKHRASAPSTTRSREHSPLPSSSGLVEAASNGFRRQPDGAPSPLPSSSGLVEARGRILMAFLFPTFLTAAVEQRPR